MTFVEGSHRPVHSPPDMLLSCVLLKLWAGPPHSSIRRLSWNDPAHSTTGLIDISRPARDQMDMAVHDGLTRRLAAVHAHVEALDCFVLIEHVRSDLIEK
jgi:hypothetical protein